MKTIFALLGALLFASLFASPSAALAQNSDVSEARSAIDRGEYVRAVNILSLVVGQSPSADAYLYLGIAYGHMREWDKAEKTLDDGTDRYPTDPRFFNELAGVDLAANDVEKAQQALRHALAIDPDNDYASDLLATIFMSRGEIQSALRFWNKTSRPIVGDIMQNSFLTFDHWTVNEAIAFHPAGVFTYEQWRTTEARLRETDIFSNVSVEVEPTVLPRQYNINVLTSAKTNSLSDIVFDVFKGAPFETTYLDWWDAGTSGINLHSSFRWDPTRRRGEVSIHAPLPLPGILFLDAKGIWRSEEWDLSRVTRDGSGIPSPFHYRSTGARIELKHIPSYRFEIGGGFEYRNRTATGNVAALAMDSRNSAELLFQTTIRPADGVYRNRVHAQGFAARRKILGDLNYSGGTVEVNNRLMISKDNGAFLDWTIKGGASRGQLPLEKYFVLGMDTQPENMLRAHAASRRGKYGSAPMGTDFILANASYEHRIAVLPFFNTFNLPFVTVKGEVFLDGGKTFDRNRIFKQGKLLVDTGAGLKFETPTHAFNLTYGRSLRDGTDLFFAYVEKRW